MALSLIKKDRPRPGEVYAYRTLKPYFGVFRHWGYAGKTRSPLLRHQEHTVGGGRWGRDPQPWADLDPKRYVIWRSEAVRDWRLALMEVLAIWLLLPVYNVQHNLANPRRITKRQAAKMRAWRDMGTPRWLVFRPGHLIVPIILIIIWSLI
jgi:hypothetical protein